MKTVARIALQKGMILGEDIVVQGKLVYAEDTKIDEQVISMLARYNIMCVTVKEDIDFAKTHYEKLRFEESFKAFEKQHTQCLHALKMLMKSFLETGRKVEDSLLLNVYNGLKKHAPNGKILMDYLYNMMPNEDELTYTHCLDSALLAGAFAEWLEMSEEETKLMIMCGFYYDVGKLQMPYEILWKPGKLTEEEYKLIKTHPIVGYRMIKDTNLDVHVKNAVLMHHERQDASGYPYGMQGEKIDIYAKYMAIVDTYAAMASPRSYRDAYTPLQILNNFEQSMDKFDVELLMPIMNRIADAQIGSNVQLDDGSVWEVLIIHPENLSRPVLKNEDSKILDLAQFPERNIVKKV